MPSPNDSFSYSLRVHPRARHLKLTIYPSRGLVVTVPKRMPLKHREHEIEAFIQSQATWIRRGLARYGETPPVRPHTKGEIDAYKQQARTLAGERLAYFNSIYGYAYKNVRIKNQRTRWGSCSRNGTLNFSYKIALLPPELADYVIVHELCHVPEMNHSMRFWTLVAKTVPDYKERRRALGICAITLG